MNFWLKLKNKSRSQIKSGTTAVTRPILALAPMAGITDSAYRQMCKHYGADVVYTEMISADGLHYDSKKTLAMLKFDKAERPVVIQLFGKHSEKFAKAAKIAEQAGFDGIDINFGCPAKKVAGHGGGVTLMRNLPKCRKIVETVLNNTKLPVSAKLRTSIQDLPLLSKEGLGVVLKASQSRISFQNPSQPPLGKGRRITALDFIKFMKGLPLSAVMIHGRPYENPFNAEIDYEMIKLAGKEFKKQNPQGVVLANGGIKTPLDAKIMIEKTNADGIGLARGLYGRPWLFKYCRDFFKKGKYKDFGQDDILKAMELHAKFSAKTKNQYGLVELRKHLLWYVSGWPNAKELRAELVRVEAVKDVKKVIKQIKNPA